MVKGKKQNILVTGASGYLGKSLINHLLKNKQVGKIIATDISEPTNYNKKVVFEKVDVRNKKKHIELLKKHKVSQIFHFAFILGEVKAQDQAMDVNIGGTRAIMEAADKVKTVKRIIFAGSVSAYGANKCNNLYIREEHPLNANTLKYGINKKLMEEEVAKSKSILRKNLKVVMLRICTIVGPTEREGGSVDAFLSLPCGVSIIGHNCPVQFIHEEDLMQIFDGILEKSSFHGTYNVSPKGYTTLEDLSRKLGKPVLPIPYSVLYAIFYLIFRIKPSLGISENSVSYLAYPIVVDNSKIKKELDINFKYSSSEAFISCAQILQKNKRK